MVLSADDAALLRLLRRFVARQRLVRQLVLEVRPFLMAGSGEAAARPGKEVMRATAKGSWGRLGEWRFHMHGLACKMVNTVTGEPLDWQPPTLSRFDVYVFLRWLTWYWRQHADDLEASRVRERMEATELRAGLLDALARLARLGFLGPAQPLGTAYILRRRR